MKETKKCSRRRFLAMGCGALCAAALASACAPQQEGEAARTPCPRGLVDDPYPGRCHRYVDSNKDGICDLSEVV